ncbi:hypothetical protein VP96_02797 [Vibrio cholerae]|nr:hypothetical protein VP96_02797 [Vibrio cholerae]KKP10118.1 hypothetical protein VS84_02871 [Vibrio cholerae]KKP14452.1 hypothetical protein VS85_01742 [Vibrio cholerae]KKP19352.1 hypothetical protein VS86_02594 [Vibrio cholerae]
MPPTIADYAVQVQDRPQHAYQGLTLDKRLAKNHRGESN